MSSPLEHLSLDQECPGRYLAAVMEEAGKLCSSATVLRQADRAFEDRLAQQYPLGLQEAPDILAEQKLVVAS